MSMEISMLDWHVLIKIKGLTGAEFLCSPLGISSFYIKYIVAQAVF